MQCNKLKNKLLHIPNHRSKESRGENTQSKNGKGYYSDERIVELVSFTD
jgi:hypothetical protein